MRQGGLGEHCMELFSSLLSLILVKVKAYFGLNNLGVTWSFGCIFSVMATLNKVIAEIWKRVKHWYSKVWQAKKWGHEKSRQFRQIILITLLASKSECERIQKVCKNPPLHRKTVSCASLTAWSVCSDTHTGKKVRKQHFLLVIQLK